MNDNTAEQLKTIELDETALNDAGWAFVEAMPHALPGPIWNELKPALRVAIAKYLNDTRADSGDAVAVHEAIRTFIASGGRKCGKTFLTNLLSDAERYRELKRDTFEGESKLLYRISGQLDTPAWDEAIDAAIASRESQ